MMPNDLWLIMLVSTVPFSKRFWRITHQNCFDVIERAILMIGSRSAVRKLINDIFSVCIPLDCRAMIPWTTKCSPNGPNHRFSMELIQSMFRIGMNWPIHLLQPNCGNLNCEKKLMIENEYWDAMKHTQWHFPTSQGLMYKFKEILLNKITKN